MYRHLYRHFFILFLLIIATQSPAFATEAVSSVVMNFTKTTNGPISAGSISIKNTPYGLLFTPKLKGLPPGPHGFHIHQNASCDDAGMAAGGHFDPKNTQKHLGPYRSDGHLGDLPVLYVNEDGTADTPVLAPRLSLKEVKGHALMIHAGGDNYSDQPEKLGGGGARLLCGVIK